VVRSRDERRQFIAGELARKYSPARLNAERRALVAWGLVPPDFDLGSFLTDLVLEQAAAYYDPVNKVMVLTNWLPPDEQREALTHELVHALQDRHYRWASSRIRMPVDHADHRGRQAARHEVVHDALPRLILRPTSRRVTLP
jgi:Zn-dependent peptidase ImmA (M78 family)